MILDSEGKSFEEVVKTYENEALLAEERTLNLSEPLSLNGMEGHKIVLTIPDNGKYDWKMMQYIWLIDDSVHILQLMCEVEHYDEYIETGEQIMNSFQIKKN